MTPGQVFSPCHGLCLFPMPCLCCLVHPQGGLSQATVSPFHLNQKLFWLETFRVWSPFIHGVVSWNDPSNFLCLLSKKMQDTWVLQGSLGHFIPTLTSTSGCNDSLLIILTDQGLYLLKHKYVTSILSKFLLSLGRCQGF